ncbi:Zinc finger CCCH domain-containing protein 13, partial [Ophiophagus hannah]
MTGEGYCKIPIPTHSCGKGWDSIGSDHFYRTGCYESAQFGEPVNHAPGWPRPFLPAHFPPCPSLLTCLRPPLLPAFHLSLQASPSRVNFRASLSRCALASCHGRAGRERRECCISPLATKKPRGHGSAGREKRERSLSLPGAARSDRGNALVCSAATAPKARKFPTTGTFPGGTTTSLSLCVCVCVCVCVRAVEVFLRETLLRSPSYDRWLWWGREGGHVQGDAPQEQQSKKPKSPSLFERKAARLNPASLCCLGAHSMRGRLSGFLLCRERGALALPAGKKMEKLVSALDCLSYLLLLGKCCCSCLHEAPRARIAASATRGAAATHGGSFLLFLPPSDDLRLPDHLVQKKERARKKEEGRERKSKKEREKEREQESKKERKREKEREKERKQEEREKEREGERERGEREKEREKEEIRKKRKKRERKKKRERGRERKKRDRQRKGDGRKGQKERERKKEKKERKKERKRGREENSNPLLQQEILTESKNSRVRSMCVCMCVRAWLSKLQKQVK